MDYTALFHEHVGNLLEEIIPVVESISTGNRYLVGGQVYRTLACALYGTTKKNTDIDVIVDGLHRGPLCGWTLGQNRFGAPKLRKKETTLDVMTFELYSPIGERRLPLTIASYLRCAPFKVQSIAYDLQERKIIGDIGIAALASRSIGVNNCAVAKAYARSYHKNLPEMLARCAKSLQFTVASI